MHRAGFLNLSNTDIWGQVIIIFFFFFCWGEGASIFELCRMFSSNPGLSSLNTSSNSPKFWQLKMFPKLSKVLGGGGGGGSPPVENHQPSLLYKKNGEIPRILIFFLFPIYLKKNSADKTDPGQGRQLCLLMWQPLSLGPTTITEGWLWGQPWFYKWWNLYSMLTCPNFCWIQQLECIWWQYSRF